jgi:hypothetical protein
MEPLMKRLAIAAWAAAVVGLTACSSHSAPLASHSAAAPATSAKPVSCSQQYQTWEHGHGKGLLNAFRAISVASTAGNPRILTTALTKARPDVTRAARYPMPACVDPRGYWGVLLMHVNAAVTSTAPASSVRAAMKDVPTIDHELTNELKATSR